MFRKQEDLYTVRNVAVRHGINCKADDPGFVTTLSGQQSMTTIASHQDVIGGLYITATHMTFISAFSEPYSSGLKHASHLTKANGATAPPTSESHQLCRVALKAN